MPQLVCVVLLLLALAQPVGPVAAQASHADFVLVQATTAELRGLTPREAVPRVMLNRDALLDVLRRDFEQEWADRHLARTQAAWRILGMLQSDLDLHAVLLSVRGAQVLGMYRTEDRTMYLLDDPTLPSIERDVVLAHEYTHALQDQHFGLDGLLPTPPPNNDFDLARLALIEGDATVTMLRYAEVSFTPEELSQLGNDGREVTSDALASLPAALLAELTFPYVEGSAFVYSMLATGTINSVFRHPPSSTEQILHPSRYFAGEAPLDVVVPDVSPSLGPDWIPLGGDVLGEFGLRTLLELHVDDSRAALASEGWGGDRWELFEDASGRQAFVLATRWDEIEDAHQFFDALVAAQHARHGAAAVATGGPSQLELRTADGVWRFQTADADVLVLFAPDGDVLAALLSALA